MHSADKMEQIELPEEERLAPRHLKSDLVRVESAITNRTTCFTVTDLITREPSRSRDGPMADRMVGCVVAKCKAVEE